MMSLKQIAARRQWLADLTRLDRSNRCPICFKGLDRLSRVPRMVNGTLAYFCSGGCADEMLEREAGR